MRLRLLLAIAAPLAVAVYFLHYNRSVVELRLAEGLTIPLPLAVVVLVSALIGALAAALLGWGEAGMGALFRWRTARRARRRERARERLAEAQRLRGRGNLRKARRMVRRAVRDDPGLRPAVLYAGDLAAEAKDLDDAIRWNERLHALAPESPEAAVRLSENLEEAGRAGDAERLLARTGGNGRAHPAVLRRLRDLLARGGRWEEALAACEALGRLRATPAEREADEVSARRILLSAAEARLGAGDGDGAADLFERAVRNLDAEPGPRMRLGDAYLAAGRPRRAVRTWEAAYRALGGAGFLQRMLAAHRPLDTEGALRQAAAAMVNAGRARPEDPVPLLMATALYFEAGRTEEALHTLDAAAGLPAAADGEGEWVELLLHLLEARGKLESGDRLAAESDFRKVAQKAGRLLLGEQSSGVVLRPFDEVLGPET